ncbi:NAD-dependent epimerase/dehydratase family protein [Candidatus Marinimicrobia bacterium MT.SAG.2]|nr:NAD-dependent epimerase/dehydratase family protein [Candidatus Marinimicrobia bacterium MT.SAG.2]
MIDENMKIIHLIRHYKEIIIRVLADAVIINVAILISLGLRFLEIVLVDFEGIVAPTLFASYVHAYLLNGPILTVAMVVIFYFHGIYTRTRGYIGKFKLLVILRAVTTAFLLFGTLHYIVWQAQLPNAFPRGVLIMGWLLTLLFTAGARVTKDMLIPSSKVTEKLPIQIPIKLMGQVLVIGGCGYIGSVLCRKLLAEGYRVRVLDNLMFGMQSIDEISTYEDFEFQKGDFRDVESVVHAMKGIDKVVHLGAIVGDPACDIDSQFTVDVNFAATRMIAEVAKGYGVERLLFASTCSVYGASNEILDEHSTLSPISLYAETKIDAEEILIKSADSNFNPVILRLATIFGYSPRPRFDLVANLFTAQAYYDHKITVVNGEQWRPFIHVEDVAESICVILCAPRDVVKGQVYNIGGNDMNYRISELGQIIARNIPGTEVVEKTVKGDLRNYRVSFDKIVREIGFHPTHSLKDGIIGIIEAFKNGDVSDHTHERYSNVSYTRRILEDERMKTRRTTLKESAIV